MAGSWGSEGLKLLSDCCDSEPFTSGERSCGRKGTPFACGRGGKAIPGALSNMNSGVYMAENAGSTRVVSCFGVSAYMQNMHNYV